MRLAEVFILEADRGQLPSLDQAVGQYLHVDVDRPETEELQPKRVAHDRLQYDGIPEEAAPYLRLDTDPSVGPDTAVYLVMNNGDLKLVGDSER